jgi:hypothetical protein|tara:strand:+ start:378 stop:755 length:378 start_codon:yes stop_codon:yes gene_type:complete
MATVKRLEKRLNDVEAWMKNFERGTGPAQTMENMNWLLSQCRTIGEGRAQADQIIQEYQQALQKNQEILNAYLDEKDLVMDWQGYIARLQEEQQEEEDAVQESEAESMDAQEQAEDGEEVGEGDA